MQDLTITVLNRVIEQGGFITEQDMPALLNDPVTANLSVVLQFHYAERQRVLLSLAGPYIAAGIESGDLRGVFFPTDVFEGILALAGQA